MQQHWTSIILFQTLAGSVVLCLSIVVSVLTGNHGQVHGGVRQHLLSWPVLPTGVQSGVLCLDLRDQQRTVLQQWDSGLMDFIDFSQCNQFQGIFAPGIGQNPGCTFAFWRIPSHIATGQCGFVSFSDQLWDVSCRQTIMSTNNQ